MFGKIIHISASAWVIAPGLFILVIFMGAMKQPGQDHKNTDKGYTYLALGDSYTIGEQVEPKGNFPNQVSVIINKNGFRLNAPDIIAQTGWTTDELETAIKKIVPGQHYDFVTLLIGVNNQYRGRTVDDYCPQFESLLKRAIRFANNEPGHVIVLSIPDWGITPFASGKNREQIGKEIDAYNSANEMLSKRYDVRYINITPGTREAATDLSLLAPDGLHPSAKEYAIWAKKVAALIQEKL